MEKFYLCIDLKSFYASVECVLRNLDPLTTNLVVADISKTSTTICLAVSPSLKAYGLSGRARLFEVLQKIKEVNLLRKKQIKNQSFLFKSFDACLLNKNQNIEVDFIIAPPQMTKYIQYSNKIYEIYLRYVALEDMHVYSIDEVFIDVTNYLKTYQCSAQTLAKKIMLDIYNEYKIPATAGIGSNLYLAKVAMDIVAKNIKTSDNGNRLASLNEMSYRKLLWTHQPLSDFFLIGKGVQQRLNKLKIYSMGDIALCSLGKESDFYNEELLYKEFGIKAELLINHAWGVESCDISDIKKYIPINNSFSSGQILPTPYTYIKAVVVVKEMMDELALRLVEQKSVTNRIHLTIGYDIINLKNKTILKKFQDQLFIDQYNRKNIKSSKGSISLIDYTFSSSILVKQIETLFYKIVIKELFIRKITISITVLKESNRFYQQISLFEEKQNCQEKLKQKEKKIQETIIKIKKKYGKNSILKAVDLIKGATAIERNKKIGGHKA